MIIFDFNGVLVARIIKEFSKEPITENLIRHIVLTSLRKYSLRHRSAFGGLVIARDGQSYWRRDMFPYYKARRKEQRAKSPLDWTLIHELTTNVAAEIQEAFPYPFIQHPKAEADDIIATLIINQGIGDEKFLIISGDQDFLQLQKYTNVKQFDPVKKIFLSHNDPGRYLQEHILRGDSGDDVPNILSDDDTFVNKNKSQRRLMQTKVDLWVDLRPEDFCDEIMLRNYRRNEQLIDLSKVPQSLQDEILNLHATELKKPQQSLFKYFMKHNLGNLAESISDFRLMA